MVVFACTVQLPAFQESVTLQSPETPRTSPSEDEPSPLQTFIGLVITIQFPPGINGESHFGGILPAISAGPIQIAVPIPRVSVGVTKMRRKLNFPDVPRYHPAANGTLGRLGINGLQTPDGFGFIRPPQVPG